MKEKELIENKKQELLSLTGDFSDKYLDDDYKELCIQMINKLSRKRYVPFVSGKLNIWAASIIHALGTVNFLFDKSFKPYITLDEIADYFKASKSTLGQKSKIIRDMFKMSHFNNEFSTQKMIESNPLNNFMVVDGFIASKDALSAVLK